MFSARANQKIVVSVVYISGMLMNSLDTTMVNVALATLGREFGVPAASVEAVIIGYLVSLAVFIPASGWLGDRFGTKRVFQFALGMFTLASLLCGMAQSLEQLILFRVLQGVGGGLLTPVGMAMLYRTFPPAERVAVSRILMFALVIGPATGPVLGGFLLEQFSWRWAFWVKVPVGLVALLFGWLFLREHREPSAGRFDLPGFLLGGAGLAALMFALSEGPARGWADPAIAVTGVAGVALMAAFVRAELRTPEPMVDFGLFRNRLFRTTLLTSFFASSAFMGVLFLVPLFLQEGRNASPLEAGLTTFPEAIGVVISTQLVARLYPRVGPRRLMAGGLFGVAAAAVLLGTVGLLASPWVIRGLMFMLGAGMAYVFLPNQAAGLATITREDTGRASMLTSVQRQIGAAIGVATVSSVLAMADPVLARELADPADAVAPYRAAFFAAAVFAVAGAVIALRVPDADASATMVSARRRAAVEAEPEAVLEGG